MLITGYFSLPERCTSYQEGKKLSQAILECLNAGMSLEFECCDTIEITAQFLVGAFQEAAKYHLVHMKSRVDFQNVSDEQDSLISTVLFTCWRYWNDSVFRKTIDTLCFVQEGEDY